MRASPPVAFFEPGHDTSICFGLEELSADEAWTISTPDRPGEPCGPAGPAAPCGPAGPAGPCGPAGPGMPAPEPSTPGAKSTARSVLVVDVERGERAVGDVEARHAAVPEV